MPLFGALRTRQLDITPPSLSSLLFRQKIDRNKRINGCSDGVESTYLSCLFFLIASTLQELWAEPTAGACERKISGARLLRTGETWWGDLGAWRSRGENKRYGPSRSGEWFQTYLGFGDNSGMLMQKFSSTCMQPRSNCPIITHKLQMTLWASHQW